MPLTEDLTNLVDFVGLLMPFADATFAVDITIGPDYIHAAQGCFCTGNAVADGKAVAEGSVVAAALQSQCSLCLGTPMLVARQVIFAALF